MTDRELIERAKEARTRAYAPYSGFSVGCALLSVDGRVFEGCNVENASYPATTCAERVAFGSAAASGVTSFQKIAIVGGKHQYDLTGECMPCGICRQIMREFCDDDFQILTTEGEEIQTYTLGDLLPHSFRKTNLTEATDAKDHIG